MRAALAVTALACLVAGCGNPGATLMPMKVGEHRTYTVQVPFYGTVETIAVVRSVSVAGTSGFELSGAMGMSRLAWSGDRLVADNLSHTRFAPAIPLLDVGHLERPVQWKGKMRLLNAKPDATAVLTQERVSEEVLGRPIGGVKSVLRLDVPEIKRKITVESTFLHGIGLVRQVQWTDGDQDVEIRLLDGAGAPG